MSNPSDFINSVGSLFDLSEPKHRRRKVRQGLGLSYECERDLIQGAWSDTVLSIAEAYIDLVVDHELSDKIEAYRKYLNSSKFFLSLDTMESVEAEEIGEILCLGDFDIPFNGSKSDMSIDRHCSNES